MRFEDLVAWQKARALAKRIYELTSAGRLSRDWGLKDQIQRAAVSIMANVAEGFERGRKAEFHHFLSIAKGSCAELRSHLYVAFDVGYISEQDFQGVLQIAEETGRVIGGLKASVNAKPR